MLPSLLEKEKRNMNKNNVNFNSEIETDFTLHIADHFLDILMLLRFKLYDLNAILGINS